MSSNLRSTLLLVILTVAVVLRFYNLMHDAPFFFNPDERNMANAIVQLSLPHNSSGIISCISKEFFPHLQPTPPAGGHNLQPNSCNLNPHFFAYGQFPLYLAFVSDQLTKPFISKIDSIFNLQPTTYNLQLTTNFPSAIFWLRFYSALSSTLTVLVVYLISKKLFSHHLVYIPALLTAFIPGLIQSAHFGTTESLLTFFFLASIYLSIRYLSDVRRLKFIILTSLTIGLAIGSKLTGLFFLIPPVVALIIQLLQIKLQIKRNKAKIIVALLHCCIVTFILIIGTIFFAVLSSPYNLVKPEDFRSAVFGYEADVATGKYEAFYTRQFAGSTPLLFQLEKIFPYALGWPVFIIGLLGFLLATGKLIFKLFLFISSRIKNIELRIKNNKIQFKLRKLKIKQIFSIHDSYFIILASSFIVYLLPNAFLFAKWSRFMTPILPFFSFFSVFALLQIYSFFNLPRFKFQILNFKFQIDITKLKIIHLLGYWLIGLLVTTSVLPGLAFMSIYTNPDSRLAASYWIYNNIPKNSYILSETANVVDIPLGLPDNINEHTLGYTVISFDFYHMDENPLIFTDLTNHLQKADYIFIPSRRIFANHVHFSKKFPLVTKYHQLLFSGALGFEKIAEINSFPTLSIPYLTYNPLRQLADTTYNLSFPDESAEETFTVFDHPVIRIYRKTKQLSQADYKGLFAIK